jgi:hypothetical protein
VKASDCGETTGVVVVISAEGVAGASVGDSAAWLFSNGDRNARCTEEYQEDLYRRTMPMLKRIPGFAGTTPWILADFRSPRRPLPGIQDGWNRKGLIGQTGAKRPRSKS